MNDNKSSTSFHYTYSAREQDEIKRIRSKYLPKEENKMELLRRLDGQTTQKATMYSIIIGVIGALIFGTGMSCCLLASGFMFVLGVIIGVIGLAVLSLAYPIYNSTLKKEQARIAPEILRLTNELMK